MSSLPPVTCEPMLAPLVTWSALARDMPAIEWLWPGWLPRGFVTMISGEPGKCKSGLALRIADSVITGAPWPDGSPGPSQCRKVLWCEAEAAQVINFDRATKWCGGQLLDGLVNPTDDLFAELRLDNRQHLARIAELAAHPEIGLVVVDSLSGAHGGDENSAESASVVKALATIAAETQKPVIVTHHLRKRGQLEGNAVTLDRVRGSTALVQYTRVVWAVDTPNPADKEAFRLSVLKNNLARFPKPLGMRITDAGITFSLDPPSAPAHTSSLEEAMDFLRERLCDGQRVSARAMEVAREERGIAERTVRRAKQLMGVEVERQEGHWIWSLPQDGQAEGV